MDGLVFYATKSVEEILKLLKTGNEGLSANEADARLKKNGLNKIDGEKKYHWVWKFLGNFKSPLVLILLFASVTSFIIGEKVNASIIAAIVMISGILNFLQEYHANKAAERLKEKVAMRTTVIRDGIKKEIKTSHVCAGDIVYLSAGDLVPADARIISARDFFVNQSTLTGEPYPAEKTEQKLDRNNPSIGEMNNIVFSSTSVITGSATAVVLKIGRATEFGKIADSLNTSDIESDFVKGVRNFSYLIMQTTLFFVLFIFFINTFFKHTALLESFTFAIAVAVGLTPELLPMILSVTMGRGSVRMAKKGVIVKRLNAIPNFGSMDILCTDKTGTLTEAVIRLVKYVDVSGKNSESVLKYAYLNSLYQTGIKNPIDEAIIRYKKLEYHSFNKIDEIPFDFERKRMSIVVEKEGIHYLITKGAPEEMFGISSYLKSENKSEITATYHALSEDGYRVLAVAIKKLKLNQKTYSKKDEQEMDLIGFVAFLDPPRQDVKEVLQHLEAIGLEVKVITGDNELVSKKICSQVGLPVKGILIGNQIDALTDSALGIAAEKTTIFARFSPEQKNRVIRALKIRGHAVGYLGDGINDAPSLKTADVGISVENAVDVAKESADMILTHKSLKELRDGVLEGRKTFGNTMKYIMMGISSNFGNMFSVLGAVLFLPFLPMLPIQILLNNLLYDISQVTIPTDSVDREYIQTPKSWNIRFIKNFMFIFGPTSSLFDFISFYVLYVVYKTPASAFQTGWFLESLTTQTLVIYIIRTRRIPFLESRPSPALFASTLFVVAAAWILPLTRFGNLFNFVRLPQSVLLALSAIVAVYLLTTEVAKRLFYRKSSL